MSAGEQEQQPNAGVALLRSRLKHLDGDDIGAVAYWRDNVAQAERTLEVARERLREHQQEAKEIRQLLRAIEGDR